MFTIEGELEHQQSNHVFTKQFIKRRVTYGFGCYLSVSCFKSDGKDVNAVNGGQKEIRRFQRVLAVLGAE